MKEIHAFGDAYDATRHAARVGNEYYDLSLKVGPVNDAEHILYIECKYRHRPGQLGGALADAVVKAYKALADVPRQRWHEVMFCFIASMPPEAWSTFLADPQSFVMRAVDDHKLDLDEPRLEHVRNNFHVFVVSARLIGLN
jgi:hypothetical protein